MGKLRDNFELWQADKLPFEELLKKVKEHARAKKPDTDALAYISERFPALRVGPRPADL